MTSAATAARVSARAALAAVTVATAFAVTPSAASTYTSSTAVAPRVLRITSGPALASPFGVAADRRGDVWAAERGDQAIKLARQHEAGIPEDFREQIRHWTAGIRASAGPRE